MKWLALGLSLAVLWPLASWFRRSAQGRRWGWTAVGFLPFAITPFHLYMAVISWSQWPGYAKGAEVSLLDLLCAALLLSLPRPTQVLPFRFAMGCYFVAVLISAAQSPTPDPALFYACQLLRMFLVYAAVARGSTCDGAAGAVLTGMVVGLASQAADQIWARAHGVLQTGGSLGHQNLLGLMSHLVVFPCVALLLSGERNWRVAFGPIAGATATILTVSRATIGLAAGAYGALFLISTLRQPTKRKGIIIAAALALAGILIPIVNASFEQRFDKTPIADSTYDEREAFKAAARAILADHPMGVGANYYVVAANTGGYNARAKVAAVQGSQGANVHNIYLLVAAETGWLGLATFSLLLAQPLWLALRYGLRARRDWRGDLLIGSAVSLATVYVHSYFEWIFITFSPQYLFSAELGIVAGMAMQLGYGRARSPRRVAQAYRAPVLSIEDVEDGEWASGRFAHSHEADVRVGEEQYQ